jgi:acetyl-CoA carboxylase biotin carboxyl carrier protein
MSGEPLAVLVSKAADGAVTLRAPRLGLWSDHPREGELVQPGSTVGTLTQLSRRFVLVVPDDVSGRVAIEGRSQDALPVEYGEPLCRVLATAIGGAGVAAVAARPKRGTLTIVAPTDGVFYAAPAAGARPFVTAGERIGIGRPVGLIEVMKTFSPIAYGGAGYPEEAEVVEVLAADGQEVRAGQPIVVVKKL